MTHVNADDKVLIDKKNCVKLDFMITPLPVKKSQSPNNLSAAFPTMFANNIVVGSNSLSELGRFVAKEII